jgi:hypothetical protein
MCHIRRSISARPRQQGYVAQSNGDKRLGPFTTLGYVSHESR